MTEPSRHALFVAYGGGHIAMVLPVYRDLVRRPGWSATILALTTAGPYLDRQGVPSVGYRHFIGPNDGPALDWGRRLAATMHAPDSGIPVEESVAYLGLCYQDLVARVGEAQAAEDFARLGRHAFLPLGVLERIITAVAPDVVVATNSPKSERAGLEVAAARGIPTLALVDLFGRGDPYVLRTDRVCVLSEITRENLVPTGVNPDAIVVTGNPAFDEIHAHLGGPDPEWRRTTLGLGDGERAIVWADQAAVSFGFGQLAHRRTETDIVEALEVLWHACAALGVRMLVRPHPSQPRELFRGWAARRPGAAIHLVDEAPLYPLLAAADAVVTFTSTVGLQATLLGRLVLTLDYESRPSDLPLGEYGLGLTAREPAQVPGLLRQLLEDTETQRRIQQAQVRLRPDGLAARRVAAEIEGLAHARERYSSTLAGSRP